MILPEPYNSLFLSFVIVIVCVVLIVLLIDKINNIKSDKEWKNIEEALINKKKNEKK